MKRCFAVPLLAALVLVGCAGLQVNQVTIGESILNLGQQFLDMANLYNQAYDQQLITRDQYKQWASFARYFQNSYPLLVEAYDAGTQTPSQLRNTVQELSNELTLLALAQ